jgi:hypothetical protein
MTCLLYWLTSFRGEDFKTFFKAISGQILWNLFQDTQNSLNFICLSDSNFCLWFMFSVDLNTISNAARWSTLNGNKYSPPSILRYIFHIKPHFSKNYSEVISKRILIICAPEEAEIFKDYLFLQFYFC